MKFKKKELLEIIDSNGDLIGNNDLPTVDANADTQASNTTDYNAKVGQQPFRYDMLGRFGFTLMPFMEGKEENEGQKELLKDLAELMHDRYMDIISHYYRNPNKLKPDYRKASEGEHSSDCQKFDDDWARKIIKVVEKHFENAFKEPENLDEATVVEDRVIDKKTEDEMANKSKDKEIGDKKLEKIADLIDKLDKEAKDKLKKLLENKDAKKDETEFSPDEKQEIKKFVSAYKGDFKDEDIHKLSEKLGLDIPEVEEFIYSIARKELKNVK